LPKHPKLKQQPPVKKEPHAASNPNEFYRQHPAWRISLLEIVDPFGWHTVTAAKMLDIRAKLANFESMTWAEILQRSNNHHHLIPVRDICGAAQRRLEALGEGDAELVLAPRLSNLERIFGILDGHILRVLWWDPDHEICPSLKR
jgi:hypothetical protein